MNAEALPALLAAAEKAAAFLERHCLETLGLSPEETVFGDVWRQLTEAARSARTD
jgi:hypothetical protein